MARAARWLYAAAALAGLLLGAAPLLCFLARWHPCVAVCWPE